MLLFVIVVDPYGAFCAETVLAGLRSTTGCERFGALHMRASELFIYSIAILMPTQLNLEA